MNYDAVTAALCCAHRAGRFRERPGGFRWQLTWGAGAAAFFHRAGFRRSKESCALRPRVDARNAEVRLDELAQCMRRSRAVGLRGYYRRRALLRTKPSLGRHAREFWITDIRPSESARISRSRSSSSCVPSLRPSRPGVPRHWTMYHTGITSRLGLTSIDGRSAIRGVTARADLQAVMLGRPRTAASRRRSPFRRRTRTAPVCALSGRPRTLVSCAAA